MGSVVIWVALGVACAVIAHNKRRSWILWLCLGLLLPIVALIVIACLSRVDAPSISVARPAEKKCPDCAEMVKDEARICRFCSHDFAADEPMAVAPEDDVDHPTGDGPILPPGYHVVPQPRRLG